MFNSVSVRSAWRIEPERAARWVGRGLLVVWAAFWLWFNIASMIGERDGQMHHLTIALITACLAAVGWFWPRVGGALLVTAGVLAASAFPNWAALTLLALPAAGIGVVLLVSRG